MSEMDQIISVDLDAKVNINVEDGAIKIEGSWSYPGQEGVQSFKWAPSSKGEGEIQSMDWKALPEGDQLFQGSFKDKNDKVNEHGVIRFEKRGDEEYTMTGRGQNAYGQFKFAGEVRQDGTNYIAKGRKTYSTVLVGATVSKVFSKDGKRRRVLKGEIESYDLSVDKYTIRYTGGRSTEVLDEKEIMGVVSRPTHPQPRKPKKKTSNNHNSITRDLNTRVYDLEARQSEQERRTAENELLSHETSDCLLNAVKTGGDNKRRLISLEQSSVREAKRHAKLSDMCGREITKNKKAFRGLRAAIKEKNAKMKRMQEGIDRLDGAVQKMKADHENLKKGQEQTNKRLDQLSSELRETQDEVQRLSAELQKQQQLNSVSTKDPYDWGGDIMIGGIMSAI